MQPSRHHPVIYLAARKHLCRTSFVRISISSAPVSPVPEEVGPGLIIPAANNAQRPAVAQKQIPVPTEQDS